MSRTGAVLMLSGMVLLAAALVGTLWLWSSGSASAGTCLLSGGIAAGVAVVLIWFGADRIVEGRK